MIEPVPEAVSHAPIPLRKPGKRAVAIVWAAVGVMVLAGGLVIGSALTSATTAGDRIFLLLLACLILLLPARIGFVYVRRRVKTGTWKISEEERLANRAKWVGPKAEGSIRRIDLIFKVMSPVLAGIFTLNAVMYVRALVRSGFHGRWAWFSATVWVLLAGHEIWSLSLKYRKKMAGPSGEEPNPGNA